MRLAILFILIPFAAYGFGLPWGKKEPEKTPEPPKPDWCYASLQIAGEGSAPKVYYIYRVPCGQIIQVGVIDENAQKIYTIDRLKISSGFEYFGDSKRLDYINKNWPNATPIELFIKQ